MRRTIIESKSCKQCGKIFDPIHSEQLFCSHECAIKYKQEMRIHNCTICGTRVRGKQTICGNCRGLNTLTERRRFEVLKRDNFTCTYCGKTVKDDVKLHIDHIIPLSRGGSNNPNNLTTACDKCNRGKSNISLKHNMF